MNQNDTNLVQKFTNIIHNLWFGRRVTDWAFSIETVLSVDQLLLGCDRLRRLRQSLHSMKCRITAMFHLPTNHI